MDIEQITLKNGLKTLFIKSPGATVTTVQIWFKAGSSLETEKNKGIAHFLEHMFFKGTKKYPNMMIASTVESFGGELNAFTSFDYTCYYINSPVNHTMETIDVLMDMVSNPQFLQEDLIPEKEVVFEEYRRSLDNPSQANFFKIQKNSFPKSYNHPILGTEKTIKGFTVEQLREFRDKHYNLENAMLIVAGSLDQKPQIINKLNEFQLPSGEPSSFRNFSLKKKPAITISDKHVNQATITFTMQAPEYTSNDSPAEDLALNCLAFGDISPLYKDLVANSSLANGTSGSTMFFSKGGCHFLKVAFPIENFDKVLKTLKSTLVRKFKTGFSLDDIDRIRNQYIASKIYEKESIESFAFTLGHGFAQTGDIHCEDDFINQMKHVSKSKVNQSLLDVFSKTIHTTMQTPEGMIDPKYKKALENFVVDINKEASKAITSKKSVKADLSKFDPEAKCIELAKNIRLVYRHNRLTPTFAFHAYLKGGIAHEDKTNNGIYNLISKNLTYGNKKLPYEKLKSELDKKSSYINGFSGKNAYGMTLHGLTEHADNLFNYFFEMLINPSFPNNFFKLEKELIHRSLFLQKEDPVKQCFRNYNNLVFNGHPYSLDIMGTEESLKKITRKKMIDLHQDNIMNKELVLTYCGDLDLETLIEKLEPFISQLKNNKRKKVKAKNKIKPITGEKKSIPFDREQTHIMIGKPSFKINTEQDLFLKMFTTFLSGQSSELFVEVRDKRGLCYSVQPLQNTALEAGYWGVYIGAGHDKKDEAIEAIFQIINKYRDKGFSSSEFKRIKKMINGQNLIGVQTNDDFANFYSVPVLHDLGLDYQHNSFKKIDKMKVGDFNKFLKSFLQGEWNIIEVGRV